MATQTRKQSNPAPRHLKSPETPKGASRQEVTAAHRRKHQAERKRPRRRSNSERLYYEKLLPYAEEQHRGNQRALHTGVGWLFALPVVLLVIQKLTGSSKIAILLAWIAGMFIISAALIHISFADYELQKYLNAAPVTNVYIDGIKYNTDEYVDSTINNFVETMVRKNKMYAG